MVRKIQSEWFTTTNPDVLLEIVRPSGMRPAQQEPPTPATARRLELFGCACARTVWDMLPTDARSAVQVRERFAYGRATDADLRASALPPAGWRTFNTLEHAIRAAAGSPISAATALACRAAGPAPPSGPAQDKWHAVWTPTFAAARAHQCELFRDIFPPPAYTPALRPDWRTSTVIALARQMDATGDFSAVPILADALQDAGCDSDTVLTRCRAESGVHCRGNWVVDLVLGRE